jgi:predicted protein tyrosine phosphatase
MIATVDPEDILAVPRLGIPSDRVLVLGFHDVDSAREAHERETLLPESRCIAPTEWMVRRALRFAKKVLDADTLLIFCGFGVSRSPAVAFAVLCQARPSTPEAEILALVLRIRPEASPNELVVSYADKILRRQGRMTRALNSFLGR